MKKTTLVAGIGASFLLSLISPPVSATLISFDDLPSVYHLKPEGADDYPDYTPGVDDEKVPMPLTDQYEHLGVRFGEGDLDDIARGYTSNWGAAVFAYEDAVVSQPNAIGSFYQPGSMSFQFIDDELPNYLSFYITGVPSAMSVSVYDSDGLRQRETLGYTHVDGELVYTELAPRHFLEFSGYDIEEVRLSTLYGHGSTRVFLDDLFFTTTNSVPEPGTLSLFLAGLLGLVVSALRRSG